ncbi:MAG: GerMN domain-containing protein [Treponema sp.]|jgi:hypothetical protein|nr:GerMN domain-containing protein [Treponema sp.]
MNIVVKGFLRAVFRFFGSRSPRYLFFLTLISLFALTEFVHLGLVRRTFVFYTIDDGFVTVEDRMLKRSPSREQDIRRYVEEALLGAVSPDLAPLFPRETRLESLLYRDGVVYADLSAAAALPPLEGGDVFRNMRTLRDGIRRNFSFVKDVRLFVEGKAAYYNDFRRMFTEEHNI